MEKSLEKSVFGTVILMGSLFVVTLFLWLFLAGNGLPSGYSGNGLREFKDVLHSSALPGRSGRRIRNANRILHSAARQNHTAEGRTDAVIASEEKLFSLSRLFSPGYFHYSRLHASSGILVCHPARASPEIC